MKREVRIRIEAVKKYETCEVVRVVRGSIVGVETWEDTVEMMKEMVKSLEDEMGEVERMVMRLTRKITKTKKTRDE